MNQTTKPTTGTPTTAATRPSPPTGQTALITTEQFMAGLHPYYTTAHDRLLEPGEPLNKLQSVVLLLMTSQDEETNEFKIDEGKIAWAFLLMCDLIEEAEKRAAGYEKHLSNLFLEFEKRLDSCHLIPVDSKTWGTMAAGKEGRS